MMSFEDRIRQIVNDREHGSSVLVNRICEQLHSLEGHPNDQERLRWAFDQLRYIDTSMVVVHHLLDSLEPHIESGFFSQLDAYEKKWKDPHRQVAENLMALEDWSDATVLLHSHSGMLIRVACAINRNVRNLKFLQTRSEPGGEGGKQCRELVAQGVDVKLVEDQELDDVAETLDGAWLGTDQYNDSHFVNKVGSRQIVRALQVHNKPVYVLGDSRKKVGRLEFSEEVFEKTPLDNGVVLITER